jgi:hypothetical protein
MILGRIPHTLNQWGRANMPAQQFDFVSNSSNGGNPCEQGATFSQVIQWTKETTPGSCVQAPVDLTDYTAKMQVRKKVGSPLLVELSTANGRIAIEALTGTISLSITAADTNLFTPGLYQYDLELTNSAGFVIRFIAGSFEVMGQITL